MRHRTYIATALSLCLILFLNVSCIRTSQKQLELSEEQGNTNDNLGTSSTDGNLEDWLIPILSEYLAEESTEPEPPVILGQTTVTVATTGAQATFPSGETVNLPPSTTSTNVEVTVENTTISHVNSDGFDGVTRPVVLKYSSVPDYNESDVVTVELPIVDNSNPEDARVVLTISSEGQESGLILYPQFSIVNNKYVVSIPADELKDINERYLESLQTAASEQLSPQGNPVTNFVSNKYQVDKMKQSNPAYRQDFSGLYLINEDQLPKTVTAHDSFKCNLTRTYTNTDGPRLLIDVPSLITPSKTTALVFVHGWQTALQILSNGDDKDNNVFCRGFFNLVSIASNPSIIGGNATWEKIDAVSDKYYFRYDSDNYVRENGSKFKEELLKLNSYKNVVLIGHSMGGMVIVDALKKLKPTNDELIDGVITLGTPFMGGGLGCKSSTDSVNCTSIDKPFLGGVLGTNPNGSRSLTSYYDLGFLSIPNPYLKKLWENGFTDLNRIYSIYGVSALPDFPHFSGNDLGYDSRFGFSDGPVPVTSAIASQTLVNDMQLIPSLPTLASCFPLFKHNDLSCVANSSKYYDSYVPKINPEFYGTQAYGRDHGTIVSGKNWQDPLFPKIGSVISRFIEPLKVTIAGSELQENNSYTVQLDMAETNKEITIVNRGPTNQSYSLEFTGADSVFGSINSTDITGSLAGVKYGQQTSKIIQIDFEACSGMEQRENSLVIRNSSGKVFATIIFQKNCEQFVSSAWVQLSAGEAGGHTCGISTNNQMYCWGRHRLGYNPTGPTNNLPTLIPNPIGVSSWKYVSSGSFFACGISDNDQVYCWGKGFFGQLGNGELSDKTVPTIVSKPVGVTTWNSISAGSAHTCGIADTRQVYCWGWNGHGQLGNGSIEDERFAKTLVVNPPTVDSWKAIHAGTEHTCAIAGTDDLYCWGRNDFGQVGNGQTSRAEVLPNLVFNPSDVTRWKSVDAEQYNTCGIANNSRIYCWGSNSNGQLGNGESGETMNKKIPTLVVNPNSVSSWKIVSVGAFHACGLSNNDMLYCWGSNGEGQLGDITGNNHSEPYSISNPNGTNIWGAISLSTLHTCGIESNAKGFCWGWGYHGSLGNGSNSSRFTPTLVPNP